MAKRSFDFVEFWAHKCRQDMQACLAETMPFINAQIENANKFYSLLAQTPEGRKKIRRLKGG